MRSYFAALGNGPLGWSVFALRNALVFKDKLHSPPFSSCGAFGGGGDGLARHVSVA